MKVTHYKQCELEAKGGPGGTLQYQCWLPSVIAKKGKKVRITQYPHTLWTIVTVFPRAIEESLLDLLGESHRYHRKVTDI